MSVDLEPLDARIAEALSAKFGSRFSQNGAARIAHSGVEGHHHSAPPQAVIHVETRDDVVWLAQFCARENVPLIAHGAGTSLEGHLAAVNGGISLDMTRMDAIRSVSTDTSFCVVEPGVTREALNQHLRDVGLFFPIDPGANATIGGMAATRASGTNAVLYGTMRDNVMSLEIVLADGRVIETGTRATKSAAGYDLTALFVGSEGTLGIITAITLRLHAIPERILACSCVLPTLENAVEAVVTAIQTRLPVARIELLDPDQVAACNSYSNLDLEIAPTLFVEFHGSGSSVDEQVATFGAIIEEFAGSMSRVGATTEERNALWKARHNAYFATKALAPNARVWTTDVCVPIENLAENILATRADIDAHGALATIVGHVGDGNYHVMFVLRHDRPDDASIAHAINERMVNRAIAVGGTCTGEHGIGLGKRDAIVAERGADGVALMQTIKRALDPQQILNPGKII